MALIYNSDDLQRTAMENVAPTPTPPLPAVGPKAKDVYQNVQVLGDLSVGQFTRLMASITEWVSPEEGCNYCHVNEGFQIDTKYTKKVARVMLAMTQRANQDWGDHVGGAGVTCYTCHRGKNVPEYVWTTDPGNPHPPGVSTAMQNIASEAAVSTSLPFDPFTPYFEQAESIRVAGDTALPSGNRSSIKQTEWIYSLMMHFSDSLGVNCTHCHNTRAFYDWEQSSPERVKAWHGIRMVREMNTQFINRTTDWLPDYRKGPLGDPLKVNCATCHQGAYQPLLGADVISAFPSLTRYNDETKTAYLSEDN
jgi:photosynthetic reaction center cytochrome c subunit